MAKVKDLYLQSCSVGSLQHGRCISMELATYGGCGCISMPGMNEVDHFNAQLLVLKRLVVHFNAQLLGLINCSPQCIT